MGIVENKQLVRRFVDAISRGDIEAIRKSFIAPAKPRRPNLRFTPAPPQLQRR